METYERPIISALVERLNEAPKLLTIITGPRQSGKTTLIRQSLAQSDLRSLYLPVDKPEVNRLLIHYHMRNKIQSLYTI